MKKSTKYCLGLMIWGSVGLGVLFNLLELYKWIPSGTMLSDLIKFAIIPLSYAWVAITVQLGSKWGHYERIGL